MQVHPINHECKYLRSFSVLENIYFPGLERRTYIDKGNENNIDKSLGYHDENAFHDCVCSSLSGQQVMLEVSLIQWGIRKESN
jgi:hypothetical protein